MGDGSNPILKRYLSFAPLAVDIWHVNDATLVSEVVAPHLRNEAPVLLIVVLAEARLGFINTTLKTLTLVAPVAEAVLEMLTMTVVSLLS